MFQFFVKEKTRNQLGDKEIHGYRYRNFFHTILIFFGLGSLLYLLGHLLFGAGVGLFLVIIGVSYVLFSLQITNDHIVQQLDGRRLSFHDAPELMGAIYDLTRRAKLPKMPAVYHVPSFVPNAFAFGSKTKPAVAVSTGLMNTLSAREWQGVLAHEISHIKNNDLITIRLAGVISHSTSILSGIGHLLIFINIPLILAGYKYFSLAGLILLASAPTLANMLVLALSRIREFDADRSAALLTGDPLGLISALDNLTYRDHRLSANFFKEQNRLDDNEKLPYWFSTHPKTKDRTQRLRSYLDCQLRLDSVGAENDNAKYHSRRTANSFFE